MAIPNAGYVSGSSRRPATSWNSEPDFFGAEATGKAPRPLTSEAAFLDALGRVVVEESAQFDFEGCISRDHVVKYWTWACRDVMPDMSRDIEALLADGVSPATVIDGIAPSLCSAVDALVTAAARNVDDERRLTVQIGGEEVRKKLAAITLALRSRSMVAKAAAFGKASNTLHDEHALGMALQSMPSKDPALSALLMHAMLGQAANPSRLVSAVVTLIGSTSEDAIKNAGFGGLIDAILAHAQNQLAIVSANFGAFSDVDLICRGVDRFHRLLRAINIYIELERSSRWSFVCTQLTKAISTRVEPRLREVSGDVSQSLRKARSGTDKADPDRLLAALNGMYLLSVVRDARESLAMNALFEKAWTETGQALEILVSRNLDEFRSNPNDTIAGQRLDFGIKMAELRFGSEYADILRRARMSAESRAAG